MSTRELRPFTVSNYVEEIRKWIGTPYLNQGRTLGVAADCAGPFIATGPIFGIPTDQESAAYGLIPDGGRMEESIKRYCDYVSERAEDARDGDLLLMKLDDWITRGRGHHLALKASLRGRDTVIHVHSGIGRCTEHTLTQDWKDKTIRVYRFRGIEEE